MTSHGPRTLREGPEQSMTNVFEYLNILLYTNIFGYLFVSNFLYSLVYIFYTNIFGYLFVLKFLQMSHSKDTALTEWKYVCLMYGDGLGAFQLLEYQMCCGLVEGG